MLYMKGRVIDCRDGLGQHLDTWTDIKSAAQNWAMNTLSMKQTFTLMSLLQKLIIIFTEL